MTPLSYPDIEIYVLGHDLNALRPWLNNHFKITEENRKGNSVHLRLLNKDESELTASVIENAVKPGPYTSVWFKSENTPWQNDQACADDAYDFLQAEIRCSNGSWQTNAGVNQPEWLMIDAKGATPVAWD